jgi:hypothetical protein
MVDDILPSNQTKLEEDLLKSVNFQARGLSNAVSALPGIKYETIPNSVVPWLILEYGLSEVSKWVPDQRRAIEEGIPWSRVRGTPQSLRLALGWINFTPDAINENRYRPYTFEIDTGEIPQLDLIDNIVALANLSRSERSRLTRLYHNYDLKPFTLNDPEAGFNLGIFSNFSGEFDEENQVWLSFLTQTSEGFDDPNFLTLEMGSKTELNFFQGLNFSDSTNVLNEEPRSFAVMGAGSFTTTGSGALMPREQISTNSLYIDTIIDEIDLIMGSS